MKNGIKNDDLNFASKFIDTIFLVYVVINQISGGVPSAAIHRHIYYSSMIHQLTVYDSFIFNEATCFSF